MKVHLAAPLAGQDSREGSGSSVAAPRDQQQGPFDAVCQDYAMSKYASAQDARLAMLEEIAVLRSQRQELLEALQKLVGARNAASDVLDFCERVDAFIEQAEASIARALGTGDGASGSPASKEQGQMNNTTGGSQ